MLDPLPILGICGWSGAGKTTLIEELLPVLRRRGLAVAAVKHDAHGLDVDRPGKDSDRLFRAGASVLVHGPHETFSRTPRAANGRLLDDLCSLARRHDLVLVEGHKHTPLPKIWVLAEGEAQPPRHVENVIATLPRGGGRTEWLLSFLDQWLIDRWHRTPLFGCVLIGGKSRRMGRAKHLLKKDGRTWLERTVGLLQQVTQRTVIAGAGRVPDPLAHLIQLPDVPDAAGPMAGMLAAMRWAPRASWLVTACDLPDLSLAALRWLLDTRAPGVWATLPMLPRSRRLEPLLAHYDFRARRLLERAAAEGNFCPLAITGHPGVIARHTPLDIAPAWRNINTEAELGSETLAIAGSTVAACTPVAKQGA